MRAEELGPLPIDWMYVFRMKDGRRIIKRGAWLLCAKNGHFAIDENKCEKIESYDLYEE